MLDQQDRDEEWFWQGGKKSESGRAGPPVEACANDLDGGMAGLATPEAAAATGATCVQCSRPTDNSGIGICGGNQLATQFQGHFVKVQEHGALQAFQ